ncbi:MAG TPA: hypothetical protein VLW75_12455, partial [Rhizomicrobium sp.]|nr:hypothetical protein [Rhizomicrobium sp.]
FKYFALSWRSDAESRESFAKLSLRIRRELREATVIARGVRQKRNGETESPENRLVAAAGRVHGSVSFIARALENAPELRERALPFIGAVRARLDATKRLLEGETAASTPDELDASLGALQTHIESFAKANPAAHLDALPFLLRALTDDLNELSGAARALSAR